MNTKTTLRPQVTAGGTTEHSQERAHQALGLRRGLGYGPRSESRIARGRR